MHGPPNVATHCTRCRNYSVGICGLCDELYCHNHRNMHEHPEPQSGQPRDEWLASGLSYHLWSQVTPQGRAWVRERNRLRRNSERRT